MKGAIPIATLFPDIGGVLLADGWDRHASARAATNFKCGVDSTCVKPASFGLENDEGAIHARPSKPCNRVRGAFAMTI
jgi:hypothetical protein